jgi:hypothetical protein
LHLVNEIDIENQIYKNYQSRVPALGRGWHMGILKPFATNGGRMSASAPLRCFGKGLHCMALCLEAQHFL